MKKYTPMELIEILVENYRKSTYHTYHKSMDDVDCEPTHLPEQLVLVYPKGGRHMACHKSNWLNGRG